MNVHGIGNGVGKAGSQGNPQVQAQMHQKVKAKTQTEDAAETKPQAAAQTQQEEKVKGVIRLLQEGHFKGVADVRLRINFFDELQAIEHESLAQAVEEQAPAVQEAVNTQIQALLDSGELDAEQTATVLEAQETFNTSAQQVVDDFLSGGGTDTGSLKEGLQMAFDTLVDSLSPLLTALTASEEGILAGTSGPPVEPAALEGGEGAASPLAVSLATEPTEPEAPEGAESPLVATTGLGETPAVLGDTGEPAAKETSILSTFMDDLTGAFSTALEGLDGALEGASTLPELSEPSGNGKAYDKFLAMYNELRGVVPAPTETAPEQTEGLDTLA